MKERVSHYKIKYTQKKMKSKSKKPSENYSKEGKG